MAVVTNVGVGHDEDVVTHRREPPLTGCPVDGHVLPEDVIISDLQERGLAVILAILRVSADDRSWSKAIIFADRCPSVDGDVAFENATRTQRCSRFHVAERPNNDVVSDFGSGVNVCEGVDRRQTYSLSGALSLKSMVILAASSPSTVASASILPTPPFTHRILISWIS